MSRLELRDAVLPEEVNHRMVKHIFKLLDCPETEDVAQVRRVAALDFTNRIFLADKTGKARKIFLQNGIYEKLSLLLKESTQETDKLSLVLASASLSLVFRLLSTPIETDKVTVPLCFLEYFLTVISGNQDDSPVRLAVSCLCLLDWEDDELRTDFLHLSGLEVLLKTAKNCRRDIKIDIIKVFANFVLKVDHTTKTHLIDVGILKYVVEICEMFLQRKLQFGGNVDDLMKQCMIFLNNFMYRFYRAKLEFFKLGGMKIITELYRIHPDEQFRKIFVERVLKILIYYNPKKKPSEFFVCTTRTGELTLRKRYPPPLKLVEESLTDCQMQTDITLWGKSTVQTNKVKRSYQIGSTVPFVSDCTHSVMPPSTILPAQIDEVGKTACGMLNCQKNCCIYIGINLTNYKVEGIEMNRDMKDRFRLSCDNIFNKLMIPNLFLSSNVGVEFVPVKDGEDVIPNLCVAEIIIKPYDDFFSYRNKTYFRYNTETMVINAESLQLLVISDESRKWLRKEEKWLKKLEELKISKNIVQSQPPTPSS